MLSSETLNAAAILLRQAGTMEDESEQEMLVKTAKNLLEASGVDLKDIAGIDEDDE